MVPKQIASFRGTDLDGGAGSLGLVAALGWTCSPWLAGQTAAPPLYAAFVVLLLGLMLVSSARSLLAVAVERRHAAARESEEEPASSHLRQLALAARASGGAEEAIARFSETLVGALGVERAALYLTAAGATRLQLVSACGVAPPASPPGLAAAGDGSCLVGESASTYYAFQTWLPVVADNTEIGRVGLGAAGGARLDAPCLALADLLCAHLALLLRNAAYRDELRSQRAEIQELRRRLEAETTAMRASIQHPERFREIFGGSEALRRVLSLVERAAPSQVSILITGETGTGKELVARAVHDLSPRRGGPLVTVNCPAIPGPLAESELFGHERGAFTDAVAARPGQFEAGDGGTVFLDEVADLPLDIQAKLLRVLQEREVRRVGGHRPRPVDVRTISATNRDLLALVRQGRFREDLYYRLAAVEVAMPPLRTRHGDVPILASFFLEKAASAYGKRLAGFTPEAIATLCSYSWPGNVRQLQNVVHRAALLCSGEVIRSADLAEIAADAGDRPASFGDSMRQEKKRRFLEALHQAGGNQSAAARLLGMSRSNFARMVRSLGITVPRRDERRAGGRSERGHQYPSSTKLT
jgi:transcriptional regulator with GAF, ATPase, and Fis domain